MASSDLVEEFIRQCLLLPHNVSSEQLGILMRVASQIRCDQLIRDGVIANPSQLAEFRRITTARMTQIMSLLALAPDIQEAILFLPPNNART